MRTTNFWKKSLSGMLIGKRLDSQKQMYKPWGETKNQEATTDDGYLYLRDIHLNFKVIWPNVLYFLLIHIVAIVLTKCPTKLNMRWFISKDVPVSLWILGFVYTSF